MTDNPNTEEKARRSIVNWEEFEKAVRAISETCIKFWAPWKREWNDDRLKMAQRKDFEKGIMAKIHETIDAYTKGAADEIDLHLRMEQLHILSMERGITYSPLTRMSKESVEEEFIEAKSVKRETIKLEMIEQEKRTAEREKKQAEREYWEEEDKKGAPHKSGKDKYYPQQIEKSREEKLLARIAADKCIVSPRSFNYLLFKNKKGEGEIILPHFSHKAEALIDLLFHEIAENIDFGTAENLPTVTMEMIESVTENPKKLSFGGISFETSEIRKRLNVSKDWTDKDIVEAARELRNKAIVAKNVKIFADEDGKYKDKMTVEGGILGAFGIKETRKIAPRTKNIQHIIHFSPTEIVGLLFYNDAVRQRFSLMPTNSDQISQRSFYRMKVQVQKLYRYLSLWDYTILTMKMARDILGYGSGTKTNITQIRERVTGYLDEMEKAGLITGWMRPMDSKGSNTMWMIGIRISVDELIAREIKRIGG